jgi:hypothetical protein
MTHQEPSRRALHALNAFSTLVMLTQDNNLYSSYIFLLLSLAADGKGDGND